VDVVYWHLFVIKRYIDILHRRISLFYVTDVYNLRFCVQYEYVSIEKSCTLLAASKNHSLNYCHLIAKRICIFFTASLANLIIKRTKQWILSSNLWR